MVTRTIIVQSSFRAGVKGTQEVKNQLILIFIFQTGFSLLIKNYIFKDHIFIVSFYYTKFLINYQEYFQLILQNRKIKTA